MNFSEYQGRARKTAQYPNQGNNLIYPVLGLASEAGEVAGKLKKVIRDDGGEMATERQAELLAELGDVLWYVAAIYSELNLSMGEIEYPYSPESPPHTSILYPGKEDILPYFVFGLVSQAGEVALKVKNTFRRSGQISEEERKDLLEEANEVLWYVSAICAELGASLDDVAESNLQKLKARAAKGTIKGDGDER